jgi:phosphoserine aminotransferase
MAIWERAEAKSSLAVKIRNSGKLERNIVQLAPAEGLRGDRGRDAVGGVSDRGTP